jgi:hypothetical protein
LPFLDLWNSRKGLILASKGNLKSGSNISRQFMKGAGLGYPNVAHSL